LRGIVPFSTALNTLRRKEESDLSVRKRTEASATISHIWFVAARSRSVSEPTVMGILPFS
jgi:hypothetical protein